MAAIDEFNAELADRGFWVMAGGLEQPSRTMIIDGRTDPAVTTPGPLVASSEYLSGFWVIDVPDPALALDLAIRGSKACNRKVQLRKFLGE
ncbi:MAG: hypothetical protein KGP10_03275 [Actinomycetales bacterium]|nr:hypothetical protein [Actinomycetales bacterium]